MKIFSITIIALIIPLLIFEGMQLKNCIMDGTEDTPEWKRSNLRIWKDTPAWDLALAVNSQNTSKIENLAKVNQELLNYRESRYGLTLLIWSVGIEKYKSTDSLLKCGANPNIATPIEGLTALLLAANYSWIDTQAKKDPKYVKLLLKYGADPNKYYSIGEKPKDNEITLSYAGRSPLIQSIGCGIEKTRALVKGGADINHKTVTGLTAAIKALQWNSPEYAQYLIVEKKAKVTDPYYIDFIIPSDNPNEKFYPVDELRYWNWVCPLDSKEYKIKMEIVKEFKRQGIDYWKTKIPESILNDIKRTYPKTWKEYIKKY